MPRCTCGSILHSLRVGVKSKGRGDRVLAWPGRASVASRRALHRGKPGARALCFPRLSQPVPGAHIARGATSAPRSVSAIVIPCAQADYCNQTVRVDFARPYLPPCKTHRRRRPHAASDTRRLADIGLTGLGSLEPKTLNLASAASTTACCVCHRSARPRHLLAHLSALWTIRLSHGAGGTKHVSRSGEHRTVHSFSPPGQARISDSPQPPPVSCCSPTTNSSIPSPKPTATPPKTKKLRRCPRFWGRLIRESPHRLTGLRVIWS